MNLQEKITRKFIKKTEISDFINLTKPDLKKMDALIAQLISDKDELVTEIASYVFTSGGKKIRPALTIACSKLCEFDEKNDNHIRLAAAVELIHTATLIHDDVVDESKIRRGRSTASDRFGNKESILIGDFLLSQSFMQMVKTGSFEVLEILSNASAIISEGEVKQLAKINQLNLNIAQYFEIIGSKTAELFASSCEVGAVVAGANHHRQSLRKFGHALGLAFQIIDDILDYESSKEDLGKNIGDDFAEGKITLPVIIALEQASDEEKKFWHRTMQNLEQKPNDLSQAISILNNHDAFEKSRKIATEFAHEAIEAINSFPQSIAKNALINLMNFSIKRDF